VDKNKADEQNHVVCGKQLEVFASLETSETSLLELDFSGTIRTYVDLHDG
jgi:hypothetical protein